MIIILCKKLSNEEGPCVFASLFSPPQTIEEEMFAKTMDRRWSLGQGGGGKLKGVKKLTPILHFQLSYPHCAHCPVDWQHLLHRAFLHCLQTLEDGAPAG